MPRVAFVLSIVLMASLMLVPAAGADPEDGTTGVTGKVEIDGDTEVEAYGLCGDGDDAASWSLRGTTLGIGDGAVGSLDSDSDQWGDWELTRLVLDGVEVDRELLPLYTPKEVLPSTFTVDAGRIQGPSGALASLRALRVDYQEGVSTVTDVFRGCTTLGAVTTAGTVTAIAEGAFSGCIALRTVQLSEGLLTVGSGAFSGCRSLSAISIPGSLEAIGSEAFAGCVALRSIDIMGATVTVTTFSGCTNLASIGATGSAVYTSAEGLLLSDGGRTLYICPPGFATPIIDLTADLPAVTQVNLDEGDVVYAVDMVGSPSVTFVESVEGATARVLRYSSLGLESMDLSMAQGDVRMTYVTLTGWAVVDECVLASGVGYEAGNGYFRLTIEGGAEGTFYPMGIAVLTLGDLRAMGSVGDWMVTLGNVPDGPDSQVVTGIGTLEAHVTGYVGSGTSAVLGPTMFCHGILCETVSVGMSNSTIGTLEDLTVGEGIAIGEDAFAYCSWLVSLTADHVTWIGDGAFAYCTGLRSVSMLSCESVGDGAFLSCRSLNTLMLGADAVTFGDGALDGCRSLGAIIVGMGASVSGNGDVPVVHTDVYADADWSFTVAGGFITVHWDRVQYVYYTDRDGDEARVFMYAGYTTVVSLTDGMEIWVGGTSNAWHKDECIIVFDPGLGLDAVTTVVEPGGSVSVPTPEMWGYTFAYWMYDGEVFDGTSPVETSMVLTGVWVRDDPLDATPFLLLAVFLIAVVATFALLAWGRRAGHRAGARPRGLTWPTSAPWPPVPGPL